MNEADKHIKSEADKHIESDANKNVESASSDAAAFCAELVRSHDFEHYAATLFLPAVERRALLALYAFNVEVVRVREHVTQPLPGEIRLQWWADMLSGQAHGGVEGNPVAAELLLAIHDFSLPVERLSRLVEEHRLDLYSDPIPTMAALEGYLTNTCSALFALAAQITARSSATNDHLARHAGLALGLTEVIAKLPRDTSRHQLFLPLDLLQSHGSGAEELLACKDTPALRMSLDRLRDEAGRHLASALSLLADVPPPRTAFLPLAMVRRDLARLSRVDRNPFLPQTESRLRTLWTLWRASRSREFA